MEIFRKIEAQKTQILGEIQGWSEARLAYRPVPGVWSAVEMLDHIVKTESGIQIAAREGLQSPHSIGVRDRLGFLFLNRIFRSDRKVKVPRSASAVLPEASACLPAILNRWDQSREELSRMLAQTQPHQLEGGVFRHPVSGWMTLPQVLEFFSIHILHHEHQLARLRAGSQGL